jgi:hypothetical protein
MIVSRTRRAAVAARALAAVLAGVAPVACEHATHADHADATTATADTTGVPATIPQGARSAAGRASAPPPTLADTVDPAATLRAYLARARMHEATRDSLVWEPGAGGADGFRAFADSTIATYTVGSAGRIEGAAGSRYVTIPIDVDVVTASVPATLHGIATLRRAVVDGANDAQRRWRIVRIEWGAPR